MAAFYSNGAISKLFQYMLDLPFSEYLGFHKWTLSAFAINQKTVMKWSSMPLFFTKTLDTVIKLPIDRLEKLEEGQSEETA